MNNPENDDIEHIVVSPSVRSVTERRQTPLLFLHGAWHGAFCWRSFMEDFARRGYRCHAISLPGHGQSSRNRKSINSYLLSDYVDILAREVAKVSPTPVIIAHSLGGFVLQCYLEKYRAPGGVLMAASPRALNHRVAWRLFKSRPLWYLKANLFFRATPPPPALARRLFLSPDTNVDLEDFAASLRQESFGALFQCLFRRPRILPENPTLVMAAERDVVTSPGEQKKMANFYGAPFVLIPDTAHNIMMESGAALAADEIDRWIREDLGSG